MSFPEFCFMTSGTATLSLDMSEPVTPSLGLLVVETGEGIEGANSYLSILEADAFHTVRGHAAWDAATDSEKIAALVQATDYIEAFYRSQGYRLQHDQGLQWPTACSNGVPTVLRSATAILANYALSSALSGPVERGIKSTSKSLEGVGDLSTVYDDDQPRDRFPEVSAMLDRIALVNMPGVIRMLRLAR